MSQHDDERSAFVFVETNSAAATLPPREDDWLLVTGEADRCAITTKDFGPLYTDEVRTGASPPPAFVLGTRDEETERQHEQRLPNFVIGDTDSVRADPGDDRLKAMLSSAEERHGSCVAQPPAFSTSAEGEPLGSYSEQEDPMFEPPHSIHPPLVMCKEGNDDEGEATADGQTEEQGPGDASEEDEENGSTETADPALQQLAIQLDQASLARLHQRCRDDELLARALASAIAGDVAPPPPPPPPPPYHHHHHQFSQPHPHRRSRMPQLVPAVDGSACKCLGASKGFHRLDCPMRR